jgi:hypothetical protein
MNPYIVGKFSVRRTFATLGFEFGALYRDYHVREIYSNANVREQSSGLRLQFTHANSFLSPSR